MLIANPPKGNRFGLARFDEPTTVASIRTALGDLPYDLLGTVPGAIGQPTLNTLIDRITGRHFTLLHVVAHGWYDDSSGETILYLLDDPGQIAPVAASGLLERLEQVEGNLGLPRLTFLATCESSAPEGERAGALGGLAQRLVRELGLPAVVAMTPKRCRLIPPPRSPRSTTPGCGNTGKPIARKLSASPGDQPPPMGSMQPANPDSRFLLVVDQFEALFTLCNREQKRRTFLNRLLALAQQQRVIITLRADFWGDCARFTALKETMQVHQDLIAPLDSAGV